MPKEEEEVQEKEVFCLTFYVRRINTYFFLTKTLGGENTIKNCRNNKKKQSNNKEMEK